MTTSSSPSRAGSVIDRRDLHGETLDESKWQWGPTTALATTESDRTPGDERSSRVSTAKPTAESAGISKTAFIVRTTVGILLITGGFIIEFQSLTVSLWMRDVILTPTNIERMGGFLAGTGMVVLVLSKGTEKLGITTVASALNR